MSYQITLKKFGASVVSPVCTIKIKQDIADFCYIEDFGYVFVLKKHHCISLIDKEGILHHPWIGEFDQRGNKDGMGRGARLNSPSSICYHKPLNTCYVVEDGGINLREIDIYSGYIASLMGGSVAKKIQKYFSKVNRFDAITFCDVKEPKIIYWGSNIINRIFKYENSDFSVFTGSGHAQYSVASRLKDVSFNNPCGLACHKNEVYVADTNNHCIRMVKGNGVYIVAGDVKGSSVLLNPQNLIVRSGFFYFIDGNKIKYFATSNKDVGVIHSSSDVISIDVDNKRNLIILEKINET